MDEHGLTVSSLCRGGFFTGTRSTQLALDDNHAAIEEAATLGAAVLVLVCGPLIGSSMSVAEHRIVDGIRGMLPAARAAGVALAVEPFHPMFLAERSAVVSLAQANRIVAEIADRGVGVAVDTYHVWWDPNLSEELGNARGRIMAVHVGDWLVPTPNLVAGRGLPGDGVIPIGSLLSQIDSGGFVGPVEVEVLNPDIWAIPVRELAADVCRRMSRLGADPTAPPQTRFPPT